jgi:CheY-like chemotaxis protein
MKILFVDDNKYRLKLLKSAMSVCADVTHALTSYEAVQAMETDTFDVIFLDHDLDQDHDLPTEDGRAVACWMAEHPHRIHSSKIIVHSFNTEAAEEMLTTLAHSLNKLSSEGTIDRYSVARIPFDPYRLSEELHRLEHCGIDSTKGDAQ